MRNDGGCAGCAGRAVAICSAESAAYSVVHVDASATYLHSSEIFVDIRGTRGADVWRCWEANVLGYTRQNRDFEVVGRLLPNLVGSFLWQLDHVLRLIAAQRSPTPLEFMKSCVAFLEYILSDVADGLEVLAVHLMSLCCGDDVQVLLLVLEQSRLVRNLLDPSLVYALDHGEEFRVGAARLLEHLELSFVLRYLLVA